MFKKLYNSGITWTVRKSVDTSILDNLFSRLESHEMYPELALVKDNNVRSAFFFTTGCAAHHEVFVKRYKCRGIKDILKHMFVPSKAVSEWRNLKKFYDRQLPCPEPLAFSEKKTLGILRDSCLITEVVLSAVPLNEYVKNMPVGLQKKKV